MSVCVCVRARMYVCERERVREVIPALDRDGESKRLTVFVDAGF